jgi:hypothetical protein
MDDRQRLEAIVSVVCKYLPPDGMPIKEAMSEIISLVDPLPPLPVQEPVLWGVNLPDGKFSPYAYWAKKDAERIAAASHVGSVAAPLFAKPPAAQPVQEQWNEDEWRRNNWRCGHGWLRGEQCEICNAAQPAQQPVGTLNISRYKGHLVNHDFDYFGELPDGTYSVYTTPPLPEQEPVAWAVQGCSKMWRGEFAEIDAKAEAKRIGGTCVAYALYISPPQRTWVGLTAEDKYEFAAAQHSWEDLCLAVEAKLKEKNGD